MSDDMHGRRATVNGLEMYYEVHGSGEPLVLLHGAYMNIETAFGQLIPTLAADRQVIAIETQGHGRSTDADRPLSYEGMADDVAALLREIGVARADVFGYSMGAGTTLQLAIRHPDQVRKIVAASVTYNTGGLHPELVAMFETITPEMFAGSPYEAEYLRLSPHPERWTTLVEKLKQLDLAVQDWSPDAIRAIAAPVLLIVGDADVVRLEHAVELFRLLGGGVAGDLVGLPPSRLAVLPGAMHVAVIEQTELLLAIIPPFLDAALPAAQTGEANAHKPARQD